MTQFSFSSAFSLGPWQDFICFCIIVLKTLRHVLSSYVNIYFPHKSKFFEKTLYIFMSSSTYKCFPCIKHPINVFWVEEIYSEMFVLSYRDKEQKFKSLLWRLTFISLQALHMQFIFFLKSPLDIEGIMSAIGECRKHLVKGHGHDQRITTVKGTEWNSCFVYGRLIYMIFPITKKYFPVCILWAWLNCVLL